MRELKVMGRSLVFIAAAIGTAACTGTTDDGPMSMGEPSETPGAAPADRQGSPEAVGNRAEALSATRFEERLLDESHQKGVHIKLYEIAPGRIAVSQAAAIGVAPFFAKDEVETWDAEFLYRRLHPEAVRLPDAVTNVALRRQALDSRRAASPLGEESAPAAIGTPPNPAPSDSGQHLLYDFASDDAAWFKANFCDIGSRGMQSVNDHGGPGGYNTWCWTNAGGVGWIKRGNQYDAHVALASASSTDSAEMKFHTVWDCGALWYVECDGTNHDDTVPPRTWRSWSTDSGFYSWGNGNWYHHGGYYGARSQAGLGG